MDNMPAYVFRLCTTMLVAHINKRYGEIPEKTRARIEMSSAYFAGFNRQAIVREPDIIAFIVDVMEAETEEEL